jgi:hypothetical protein
MPAEPGGSTVVKFSVIARFLAPILLGMVLSALAFAWLSRVNPFSPFINDDSVRDELLARDCVELGYCHLIGPVTSVSGIHQGAAWTDLLVAVRLVGGGEHASYVVVLVLLALAAGTLFVSVWRWVRPSLAFPAAVLFVYTLRFGSYSNPLINPSAAPLPDTLTAAALMCYGLSARRRYLAVAAFALGLGMAIHVGSFSLAPSLIVLTILASGRPLRALLLGVSVCAVTYMATSRAALFANLDTFVTNGWLVPLLVASVTLLLASAGLRPWYRRRSRDARLWIIGTVLLLPFALGTAWLLAVHKHHFSTFYLHPVLGPAAVFGVAVLGSPFEIGGRRFPVLRWAPTVAWCVAFAWLLASAPPLTERAASDTTGPWTMTEASAITKHVAQRGWAFDQLPFRIQSDGCRELLVGMSVTASPTASAAAARSQQLQIRRATRAQAAALVPSDEIVPVQGDTVVIVREFDSWMQAEAIQVCRLPLEREHPPVCVPARVEDSVRDRRDFLYLSWAGFGIPAADVAPPYVTRFEIPLSPQANGERGISLTDHTTPSTCGWHLTQVNGVEADRPLPARHVRLRARPGGPRRLVLERPFGTAECPDIHDTGYPPCLLEIAPGDPLHSLLEND